MKSKDLYTALSRDYSVFSKGKYHLKAYQTDLVKFIRLPLKEKRRLLKEKAYNIKGAMAWLTECVELLIKKFNNICDAEADDLTLIIAWLEIDIRCEIIFHDINTYIKKDKDEIEEYKATVFMLKVLYKDIFKKDLNY